MSTAGEGTGSPAGLRSRQASKRNTSSSQQAPLRSNNPGGMLRFYTEDSPGLMIGPVPVLVMSLVFIFSVFLLHIMGKIWRSAAASSA